MKCFRIFKISLCLLLLLMVSCSRPQKTPLASMAIPDETGQVVLVTTPSWTSPKGDLQRFEKSHDQWIAVGHKISVTVGRTGLAWGRGLHEAVTEGPEKIEGDGKSPSGIFSLGVAFGYNSSPPAGVKLAYRQATERDFFIDDSESPDYNRWVSLADSEAGPRSKWGSFERMKRDDDLYELGIVIEHNENPVVKGMGSAIFFHIWRDSKSATAGCTAMVKEDLVTLMRWLDPEKHPLVTLVPIDKIQTVKMKGD